MKRLLFILAALSAIVSTVLGGETPAVYATGEARWKKTVISVAVSQSLLKNQTAIRPESDVTGAVERSFAAWEKVAGVEFSVTWTDRTSVSAAGRAGDGVNLVTIAPVSENLLMFGGESSDAAARTRVFPGRRGELAEADIVLNPYQQFSTDGAFGTFDLEATLTHEIGHLLGLGHSPIAGATMNDLQARNGMFGLPGFAMRTLGADDIARVRALYGALDDSNCCGSLSGRLTSLTGAVRNADVWLEDVATGRTVTGVRTSDDGAFALRGVNAGRYRLMVQDGAANLVDLGVQEIGRGRNASLVRKVLLRTRGFDVGLGGVNGQLSRIALPLTAGKSTVVYLGGRGLDASEIEVFSTSPGISFGQPQTRSDFGDDIDVVAVEVYVAPETVSGEYSIGVRTPDGGLQLLAGRITVERFGAFVTPANDE